jgi:hypothetical protein
VSGLQQRAELAANPGVIRRIAFVAPMPLPARLRARVEDFLAETRHQLLGAAGDNLPAVRQVLGNVGVLLRKLQEEFYELSFAFILQERLNLHPDRLRQAGLLLISRLALTLQKDQTLIALARSGNAPIFADLFQILEHDGDPMLAVDRVRAGTDRIRQTLFIQDDLRGILPGAADPGDQAAIAGYRQLGHTALLLIPLTARDDLPAGPLFEVIPRQVGKRIRLFPFLFRHYRLR